MLSFTHYIPPPRGKQTFLHVQRLSVNPKCAGAWDGRKGTNTQGEGGMHGFICLLAFILIHWNTVHFPPLFWACVNVLEPLNGRRNFQWIACKSINCQDHYLVSMRLNQLSHSIPPFAYKMLYFGNQWKCSTVCVAYHMLAGNGFLSHLVKFCWCRTIWNMAQAAMTFKDASA